MNSAEWVTAFKLEDADGKNITRMGERIPEKWRSLIAWAMDGDCEGWYVHIGCMVSFGHAGVYGQYIDFGHAKLWTPEDAYTVAREAQRFLSATRWN